MIHAATSYIVDHGLNFNPAKTTCKTFGTCNFKRRNSPLFATLGTEKIDQLIKRQQLTLLRNALQGNSKAKTFYMGMMRMYNQGNTDQYLASLLSRCKRICNSERFSLHNYM